MPRVSRPADPLGAKARRAGGDADGEVFFVEDFFPRQIC